MPSGNLADNGYLLFPYDNYFRNNADLFLTE